MIIYVHIGLVLQLHVTMICKLMQNFKGDWQLTLCWNGCVGKVNRFVVCVCSEPVCVCVVVCVVVSSR